MLQFAPISGRRGKDGKGEEEDDGDEDDVNGEGDNGDENVSSTTSTSSSTSSTATSSTSSNSQISSFSTSTHTTKPPMTEPKPTSSSSSPSSNPTGTGMSASDLMIHFAAPSNVSTCDSTTFFWTPVGPPTNISLSVTNSSVRGSTSDEPITAVLTNSISTNVQLYTWLTADVVQGWYLVEAELTAPPTTVLAKSAPFFVKNGSDTSCVQSHSSSPGPSPTSSTPQDMDGGHGFNASILGAVIAVVGALFILLAAFLFPRWWRRALPSNRKRRLLY
ncbi:hypothetical protein D9758_001614 [Tetrapyrgos nigripes]|uniref:Uncharacterized protein n=1 Tax=Tetrapyrgos nigripes TaxID=182062 RepID=A0A8H5LXH3_9AGAR|nr:hypothetical protein D9758_001614 [Tetrapyrgos nigripes]